MYGLEYAKSLHMDREFLSIANDIRKKLTDDYSVIERLTQRKTSKYNKELFASTSFLKK
jgi:DNA mismatch repair protein MutS